MNLEWAGQWVRTALHVIASHGAPDRGTVPDIGDSSLVWRFAERERQNARSNGVRDTGERFETDVKSATYGEF